MYTYEEAIEASKEYFNGEELPARVTVDKYLLRDNNGNLLEKSPDDIHKRIASEFARIEAKKFHNPLSYSTIYNMLKDFRYILPQGSPMFGIGNNHQIVSLSNCYLLDVPLDSYNSILEIDKQLVNISKRRGGVGVDLTNLRPKNTPTNNAARASTGITSWMERYSNSIREVGQNARRGALMLTISIHHPDILDFCTIKNDSTKVTGANISVRLTREFLNAVKNNEDYELRWPEENPKIRKMVSAKEVWDTIINSAWLRAEPGLLMWDNVTENTPADCYEEYRSKGTNPCQPAFSKFLTPEGIRNLSEINESDLIWSSEGWTTVVKKWSTGIKEVKKYITTAGIFYGTKDHRVISNGEKINVDAASVIDILRGPTIFESVLIPEIVMDGLVLGDGSVHKASNNLVHLNIGQNDKDYFNSEIKHLITKHRPGLHGYAYEVRTSISHFELPHTYDRKVPDRYIYGTIDEKCSFLRGLYSANGSVCGNRITLAQTSFAIIEDVQLMLSSLGIKSYWTKNKSSTIEFINGNYTIKPSYDLNISTDRDKFIKLIGFIQQYKNDKIKITNGTSRDSHDICVIEDLGEHEVFDITVDNNTHTYWTQGCNVSNCSEINLSPLDSCRLLCLNLLSYVVNPFTDNAYFDYGLFYEHSQIAQRLMDDMVDLESEKVQAIIAKIDSDPEPENIKQDERNMWGKILRFNNEGRRTGTGITALGDTLAALGIKYGSEESIQETEKIYKALKFGCYRSSIDMAKELGTFKCWDADKEKNCKFLSKFQNEILDITIPNTETTDVFNTVCNSRRPIFGKEIYNDMQKHGRRNIALTTTAPTGTLSILTQTSSGVEPVFMLSYIRRKKINPNDEGARVDFTDANGDKWQEFTVYHPTVKKWMEITGKTNLEESPWFGATANDINWVNRVRLQSAAQDHVCHAISSTVNLPENITREEVAKIYETAFSSNCKGMTIYRENCRSGVLVSKDQAAKKNNNGDRPKELPCEVFHTTIKGTSYFVLVGLMDGNPYEVFAGRNGFLDKGIKSGKIIKIKKRQYKAIFEDDTELSPITATASEHEETITRLTSALLRSGASMQSIVQQLERVGGDMHSFAKGLSRVLKKYIPDGTEEKGEECPECKQKCLVRAEGCVTCKNCNWSKCS